MSNLVRSSPLRTITESPRRPRCVHAVRVHIFAVACGFAVLALAGSASAQAAAQSEPSLLELKAAAYDAQQAASAADTAAAEAQSQAEQAHGALEAAKQAPPPPPPAPVAPVVPVVAPAVAATAAPPAPVVAATAPGEEPVTREELERAIEKAENAAAVARRAQEELDAFKEQHRKRYARKGLTLSAGAFWAPNMIDTATGVSIDSSRGLSGGIGYRVHPNFSIDSNFAWVEGFTVEDERGSRYTRGDLSMWSVVFGGKVYMLTGKIQPYLGLGFGAAGGKYTEKFASDGAPAPSSDAVAGVISFNGGLELYVSESLAIGADAAIYLPGGDLSGLDFSTLGAKLIYRF